MLSSLTSWFRKWWLVDLNDVRQENPKRKISSSREDIKEVINPEIEKTKELLKEITTIIAEELENLESIPYPPLAKGFISPPPYPIKEHSSMIWNEQEMQWEPTNGNLRIYDLQLSPKDKWDILKQQTNKLRDSKRRIKMNTITSISGVRNHTPREEEQGKMKLNINKMKWERIDGEPWNDGLDELGFKPHEMRLEEPENWKGKRTEFILTDRLKTMWKNSEKKHSELGKWFLKETNHENRKFLDKARELAFFKLISDSSGKSDVVSDLSGSSKPSDTFSEKFKNRDSLIRSSLLRSSGENEEVENWEKDFSLSKPLNLSAKENLKKWQESDSDDLVDDLEGAINSLTLSQKKKKNGISQWKNSDSDENDAFLDQWSDSDNKELTGQMDTVSSSDSIGKSKLQKWKDSDNDSDSDDWEPLDEVHNSLETWEDSDSDLDNMEQRPRIGGNLLDKF